MAHHHGAAHAHLHEKRDPKGRPETEMATYISIEYVTLSQTFSGAVEYSTQSANTGALVTSRTSSSPKTSATSTADDDGTSSAPATSKAAQTSSSAAAASTSVPTTSAVAATSIASSVAASSSLIASSSAASSSVASSSKASSSQVTPSQAGAAASSSATLVNHGTSSSGMSGGAKAGLAIGLILAIGLLIGIAFIVRRRKERQQHGYNEHLDNEKHGISNGFGAPPVAAAAVHASDRSTTTPSTAPRLSLRPVTQFLPNLGGNRRSAGNALDFPAAGGAASAAAHGYQAPAPQPALSPWERRGAQNNANDPANPFGNHAEVTEPAMNEKARAAVPATTNASSGRSLTPPLVTAAGTPSEADQRSVDVPKPLSIKSNNSTTSFTTAGSEPKIATASTATNPAMVAAAAVAASGVAGAAGAGAAGKPAQPDQNNVYRVLMDFVPSMDDELEMKEGQLVRMLHEYDDGWTLCVRMDRSQQGVVPRTCLSKQPVQPKPRSPPANGTPPQGRSRGASQSQQSRPSTRGGPNPRLPGPGRSQSPAGGRNSPGPLATPPGPQSPASARNSPGFQGPRMPGPGRMQGGFPTPPRSPPSRMEGGFPAPPRSPAQGGFPRGPGPQHRGRSQSNAGLPGVARPMTAGSQQSQSPDVARRRSKSVSNAHPNAPSPLSNAPPSRIPVRKPVPGQQP